MKLIISTVFRGSKANEPDGYIYIVDVDKWEVIKEIAHHPNKDVNFSEVGGSRGLRGIIVYNDFVYITTATGVNKYCKESLSLIDSYNDKKIIHGSHEMCLFENHLWVSCACSDSVVKLDLDLNPISATHFDFKNNTCKVSPVVNWKHAAGKSHLNCVSCHNNRLVVAGINSGLFDFSGNLLQKSPGHSTHNFYEYNDFSLVIYTRNHYLLIYINKKKATMKKRRLRIIQSVPLDMSHQKNTNKYILHNWHRGLYRKDDLVYVGSSPARISEISLSKEKVLRVLKLSNDVGNAVHGLELFEV